MLTSDVALLADLPITRAIMTSPDPVTIQDASQDVSEIANSDLFVLVDRSGKVVAVHTKTPGFTRRLPRNISSSHLMKTAENPAIGGWASITSTRLSSSRSIAARRTDGTLLGFLVIGYEINDRLAAEVSKVAGSQVAFSCGNECDGTTLPARPG